MFLHNVNYNNFDIQLGDTLLNPLHLGKKFDAIVSNPPYSLKWVGKDNALLINDDRYSPAGVLAPKNAADLAFTMHMLYHLKESGTCAIVEFPGVLYRNQEKQIRKYLLMSNYVDTVIQLPANLFFGVTIATCIIVLKRGKKKDGNVLFINASNEYVKNGNKNLLQQQNMDKIVDAYINRKDEQYFCKLVSKEDILANDCNLNVSRYVEAEDTREKIDIKAVNNKLIEIVNKVEDYRKEVNSFVLDWRE